jgi:glycosyltransferase involved in cell wall biosynthesis
MSAHLLLVGGEDHNLRIPFMNALRSRGYKITVAATGDPEPFLRSGFAFRRFQFNRFFDLRSDWRATQALKALLRDVDADIAHSFDTKLGILVPFAARANPRTSIVRTINGRGWVFSSRSPSALALRAAYLPLQRLASSFTEATVFEHSGDRSFFERNHLIGGSEPVLIPGAGIDIEGFERSRQSGPTPENMRREFGLQDAEIVTTVTRVTKQKGIPALLKAAELVHHVRPSVRFLIVGPRESEGPFGVSDREIQRRSPYVLATGSRADVASILAMSDLFAFPSEYAEGVPRALMEAALCALPIVTTDLPGCREVVRDGWNGAVTPLRNPRKLAETIIDLLSDRAKALEFASRGPDFIRTKFSLDHVVDCHAELYERLFRAQDSRRAAGRPGGSKSGPTVGPIIRSQTQSGFEADPVGSEGRDAGLARSVGKFPW